MKIVKQIIGKKVQFGGEEHEGWLPPNASVPKPIPVEKTTIDIEISKEGGGYLIVWQSQSGSRSGDTWHESLEDAENQAKQDFGIEDWEWESKPDSTEAADEQR